MVVIILVVLKDILLLRLLVGQFQLSCLVNILALGFKELLLVPCAEFAARFVMLGVDLSDLITAVQSLSDFNHFLWAHDTDLTHSVLVRVIWYDVPSLGSILFTKGRRALLVSRI